jgi:hypothetical protein
MEPFMYVVIFMCLRAEPAKCEVWNMDYGGVNWRRCALFAEDWKNSMSESSYYNVTHARCSLNKVEADWLR